MTVQRYVNGELIEKEELRSLTLNSLLSGQIGKSIRDVRRRIKNSSAKNSGSASRRSPTA